MIPRVSELRFVPADGEHRADGLRGWASFLLGGMFRVEGITVRRLARGGLTISYPFRDDGYGKRWHYLRPINEATRRAVEEQVLRQLRDNWGIAG